jgi:chromosome segregation ATPase
LSDDTKIQLAALLPFLRQSVDDLVKNAEQVRSIFQTVENILPENLVDVLNAASYLDSHRLTLQRARQRIASRAEQKKAVKAFEFRKVMATTHKGNLDRLMEKPSDLKVELEQLKQEAADLERALADKKRAIEAKEKELSDLPDEINREKALLSSAIQDTIKMAKSAKPLPGTDDEDKAVIDTIDNIRRRALELVSKHLE